MPPRRWQRRRARSRRRRDGGRVEVAARRLTAREARGPSAGSRGRRVGGLGPLATARVGGGPLTRPGCRRAHRPGPNRRRRLGGQSTVESTAASTHPASTGGRPGPPGGTSGRLGPSTLNPASPSSRRAAPAGGSIDGSPRPTGAPSGGWAGARGGAAGRSTRPASGPSGRGAGRRAMPRAVQHGQVAALLAGGRGRGRAAGLCGGTGRRRRQRAGPLGRGPGGAAAAGRSTGRGTWSSCSGGRVRWGGGTWSGRCSRWRRLGGAALAADRRSGAEPVAGGRGWWTRRFWVAWGRRRGPIAHGTAGGGRLRRRLGFRFAGGRRRLLGSRLLAPHRHRPRRSAGLLRSWTVRSPPTRPNGRALLRIALDHRARLDLGVWTRIHPRPLTRLIPTRRTRMVPGFRTWMIPALRTPAPSGIWTPLTFALRTRPTFSFWAPVGLLPGTWVGLPLRARVVLGVRVCRGTGRPDRLVRWGSISVALPRPTRPALIGRDRGPGRRGGRFLAAVGPGSAPERPAEERAAPPRAPEAVTPRRRGTRRSRSGGGGGSPKRSPGSSAGGDGAGWGVPLGRWASNRLARGGAVSFPVASGSGGGADPGGSGGSGRSGSRRPGPGVGSVVRSTQAPSCGPPDGRQSQPIGAGALPRQPSTTWEGPIPPTAAEG